MKADMKKASKPKKEMAMGVSVMTPDDDKWRVEDAMRTIHRAEEHKKDKDLMRKVSDHARSVADACEVKVEKAPRTMKGMK